MANCPKCLKGQISIDVVLAAKPLGSYSISGTSDKVVAIPRAQAFCGTCDFKILGFLEDPEIDENGKFTGGYFVQETTWDH